MLCCFRTMRLIAKCMVGVALAICVQAPLLSQTSLSDASKRAATKAKQKPNILYLLCDDLGIGDVRAYNPNGKIDTKNMDALAAQGIRFTDAHSGSAVCTPTRYGILCGRYAWRSKLQNGVLGGLSPSLIDPQSITVPKFLQQNGYQTACIGKWHLGMDWVKQPGKDVSALAIENNNQVRNVDYSKPFGGGPLAAGFDRYFGISASLDMVPYTFLRDDRVEIVPTVEKAFGMKHRNDQAKTRSGPAAESFEAEHVLPRLTQEVVNYLKKYQESKSDRPFFLYVPFASPHTPTAPTDEWIGKSGLNPYADFVLQQDHSIGQILDALKRLGLEENTMVFFTSDNGCSPQAELPLLREKGHDPVHPFRGHKADIYEGGHRVPMVVRWPNKIKPGTVSHSTVCLTDLMATMADILEVPLAENAGPDSFSWKPILQGDYDALVRPYTIHHSINGSFAIRRGDKKLCFCADSGGWSDPKPTNKPDRSAPLQLFDLTKDLQETNNIVSENSGLVQELIKEMEACIEQGRSRPGPKLANDVDVQLWKRIDRPRTP